MPGRAAGGRVAELRGGPCLGSAACAWSGAWGLGDESDVGADEVASGGVGESRSDRSANGTERYRQFGEVAA